MNTRPSILSITSAVASTTATAYVRTDRPTAGRSADYREMLVRFQLRVPMDCTGSLDRFTAGAFKHAAVAQLVERLVEGERVAGSIPARSTLDLRWRSFARSERVRAGRRRDSNTCTRRFDSDYPCHHLQQPKQRA